MPSSSRADGGVSTRWPSSHSPSPSISYDARRRCSSCSSSSASSSSPLAPRDSAGASSSSASPSRYSASTTSSSSSASTASSSCSSVSSSGSGDEALRATRCCAPLVSRVEAGERRLDATPASWPVGRPIVGAAARPESSGDSSRAALAGTGGAAPASLRPTAAKPAPSTLRSSAASAARHDLAWCIRVVASIWQLASSRSRSTMSSRSSVS